MDGFNIPEHEESANYQCLKRDSNPCTRKSKFRLVYDDLVKYSCGNAIHMKKSASHFAKEDFFIQETWTVLDDQNFPEQKINTRTQENLAGQNSSFGSHASTSCWRGRLSDGVTPLKMWPPSGTVSLRVGEPSEIINPAALVHGGRSVADNSLIISSRPSTESTTGFATVCIANKPHAVAQYHESTNMPDPCVHQVMCMLDETTGGPCYWVFLGKATWSELRQQTWILIHITCVSLVFLLTAVFIQ